jgi:WD40 repeat protein
MKKNYAFIKNIVFQVALILFCILLLAAVCIYGLFSGAMAREYPFISINNGRYFPLTLFFNAIVFSTPIGILIFSLNKILKKWSILAWVLLVCWVLGWCSIFIFIKSSNDLTNRIDLEFHTSRNVLNEKIQSIEKMPMSISEIKLYLSDLKLSGNLKKTDCDSLGSFTELQTKKPTVNRRGYTFSRTLDFDESKNIKIVCRETAFQNAIADQEVKLESGLLKAKEGLSNTNITKTLSTPTLVATKMHSSSSDILAMAYLSNDQHLVTGGNDGSIRLWDVNSGRLVRTIQTNQSIQKILVTPNDKHIITTSNSTIGFWTVSDGKLVKRKLAYLSDPEITILSNDGKLLAYANRSGTIYILDIDTDSTFSLPNEYVEYIAKLNFSPSGKNLIVTNGENTTSIYDLSRRQVIWSEKSTASSVQSVDFINDTGSVVFVEHLDGGKEVRVREKNYISSKSAKMVSFQVNTLVRNSLLSNDRTKLIFSGTGWLRVLDLNGFTSIHYEELRGSYSKLGSAIAISHSGELVTYSDEVDLSNSISTWDLTKKRKQTIVIGKEDGEIITAKFSADGSMFGTLSNGIGGSKVVRWSLKSNSLSLNRFKFMHDGGASSFDNSISKLFMAESDDSTALRKMKPGETITISLGGGPQRKFIAGRSFDKEDNSIAYNVLGRNFDYSFSIDQSETYAITSGDSKVITLWDLKKVRPVKFFNTANGVPKILRFSRYGNYFASTEYGSTAVKIWDINSSSVVSELNPGKTPVDNFSIRSVDFCASRSLVAASDVDGSVRIWDFLTGKEVSSFRATTKSVAMHPSCEFLATVTSDGSVNLWKTASGVLLATLTSFSDGTWIVSDAEGRFDTSDLEGMPHLHWILANDPLAPVPLEAFMKDYYEPRLLARILAGETFKPVRSLTSLNRTQPQVKIVSVVPEGSDPTLVRVTVSAAGATKSYLQGEGASSKDVPRPTAVHDLRLFRDGQVVGYADGKLVEFSASGSPFTRTFTVRLPRVKAGQDVVFSAYAFNDDRVKSETVRSTYKAPASIVARKGKAYVISMGVNSHDNAAWNLNFAANDARLVSRTVSEKLAKSTQHQEVVAITLVSDGVNKQASKAAMKAILDRMSGKPLDAVATALLQTIKGADKLQTATPDDLVLLSFSGHGFADDSGNFYLIPQDTGAGTGKNVTPELRQHSISSEELSIWLRDVDAGDMTMIVDACQSAASVQGNDFKPGPMGSRGLGQLAFDKGMRILAASQSDEEALEDGRIQQGLLSYALVRDGLDEQKADYKPADKKITLDEWLNYGVSRVPSLADDVKAGKLTAVKGAIPVSADGKQKKASNQQPSLFDFAKGRREVLLDVGLK